MARPTHDSGSQGVKLTKAAKRAAATEKSWLQRGEPSTATLERPVPGAPITIHDFQHWRICDIIRETFASDPAAHSFHYHPYELKWKPPGSDFEQRVHGELYTSQAWLDEDAEVQSLALDPAETDNACCTPSRILPFSKSFFSLPEKR